MLEYQSDIVLLHRLSLRVFLLLSKVIVFVVIRILSIDRMSDSSFAQNQVRHVRLSKHNHRVDLSVSTALFWSGMWLRNNILNLYSRQAICLLGVVQFPLELVMSGQSIGWLVSCKRKIKQNWEIGLQNWLGISIRKVLSMINCFHEPRHERNFILIGDVPLSVREIVGLHPLNLLWLHVVGLCPFGVVRSQPLFLIVNSEEWVRIIVDQIRRALSGWNNSSICISFRKFFKI